jgi:hypothetical protein
MSVSHETIRRCLNGSGRFKYKKMNKAPKLTERHKQQRREWAEKHVDFGHEKWSQVVFSDEKKWNLDGPDGLKSYWHAIGHAEQQVFSRQQGGGSVMVWGGIWADGKSKLAILEGSQDSGDYVYTLSEFLLPAAQLRFGTDYIFQQDNASIHTSRATKTFFEEQNLTLLDWPALSPDLNPIENVWGYLVQQVYRGGKQYHTTQELKTAILAHWEGLSRNYLNTLIKSMKKRCLEVVRLGGNTTKYYISLLRW